MTKGAYDVAILLLTVLAILTWAIGAGIHPRHRSMLDSVAIVFAAEVLILISLIYMRHSL